MARLDAIGSLSNDGNENPVIRWQISGLDNPFTTQYYRSVGISTQAAVSGASSVSGILDQVNAEAEESSSYINGEVVCAPGTYTVYGWARALNGLYYPIQTNSPITLTVPFRQHKISSLSTSTTETSATLTARVVVGGASGSSYSVHLTAVVNGTQYTGASVTGTCGSTITLSVTVTGLTPGTTYSYRLVAEGGQSGYMSDAATGSFTTAAAISWSLSAASLGTLSDAYSGSYSFGAYVLRRFTVQFANSGTAKFYSSGGPDTKGWLSTTTAYNSSTGEPTDYVAYNDDDDGDVNFGFTYEVTAGTTYYLWVRLYNGTGTGTTTVCIDPPQPVKYYAVLEFDPNGGIGGPSVMMDYGVDTTLVSITLPAEVPTRENYKFLYWLYGGAAFYPGTTYLFSGSKLGVLYTLTAVWELTATDRIGSGGQYKRCVVWIGHGGKWCKAKRWIGSGGAWKQ